MGRRGWRRRRCGEAVALVRSGGGIRKEMARAQILSLSSLTSARDLAHDKDFFNLKIHFAECPGSDTRQRRHCRVPTNKHSTKNGFRVLKKIFAECPTSDTRQRLLCRVPAKKHSTKRRALGRTPSTRQRAGFQIIDVVTLQQSI